MAPWVKRDGAKERGWEASDWSGNHEWHPALPKSHPNGKERTPKPQNSASGSFLFSDKQKQTWKTTQDSDALLRTSKQLPIFYTNFLLWGSSTEKSALCLHPASRALKISNLFSYQLGFFGQHHFHEGYFAAPSHSVFPFNLQQSK